MTRADRTQFRSGRSAGEEEEEEEVLKYSQAAERKKPDHSVLLFGRFQPFTRVSDLLKYPETLWLCKSELRVIQRGLLMRNIA